MGRRLPAWIACLLLTAQPAAGEVFLTREEALSRAFPEAIQIERKSVFLTDEQVSEIQKSARAKVGSKIVTYYAATEAQGGLGYAFIDTRTVRTMPITYMTVVDADSSVRAVEILAFHEPQDYLPSSRWLSQFDGKTLDANLLVRHGIQGISGATLSAASLSDGVRTILATFEVAVPKKADR